jgi:hypothetical protein
VERQPQPRLSSISGVARALIATVGVDDAVTILTSQFGWDVAFIALARLEVPEAAAALWRAAEQLLVDDVSREAG